MNCQSRKWLSADLCVQDGVAMLWDLAEGKRLYSLDAGDVIHALTFSPNRYWLCAATQQGIKVCLVMLHYARYMHGSAYDVSLRRMH